MALRPARTLPRRIKAWTLAHPFLCALVVNVLILCLVVGRVEWIRSDSAASTAATNLGRCQDRNAQQAGIRSKLTIQNEVLGTLGIDPTALARLAVVVGIPDDEDTDCNSDGRVDLADYPDGRTPAEVLAALRTAAGLVVTSNPDAPVEVEATPGPETTPTTAATKLTPRRRTTTTTTRPTTTTTSAPTSVRPAPPTTSTTAPCTLLGVLIPLCPIPGL